MNSSFEDLIEKISVGRGVFVAGTDTGVGKTVAATMIASRLAERGIPVAAMKPIETGRPVLDEELAEGSDGRLLQQAAIISGVASADGEDAAELVSPYRFPNPVSPHIAFTDAGELFELSRVSDAFNRLRGADGRRRPVIVEAAGGLLTPITHDYFMADLARDLSLDVVLVTDPSLGTFSRTLLCIEALNSRGIGLAAVILNPYFAGEQNILQATAELSRFTNAPVIILPPAEVADEVPSGPAGDSQSDLRSLVEADLRHVWHPFTQMSEHEQEDPHPLVIEAGEGTYLIDSDGRRYIDGVSSLWVNLHGHNEPRLNRAIKQQLDRIAHITMLGLSNRPATELARRLVEVAPAGLNRVFYSDSGSTAVEIALKMAFQYWEQRGKPKKTFLSFKGAYHGDTLGSVSVGGIDLFHEKYRELLFPALHAPSGYCYRCELGLDKADCGVQCLAEFEKLLRKNASRLAAVIIEPLVQGAAGIITWPSGFLRKVRELTLEHDVLLIADEVATGFGRTGAFFACEQEGVAPDLLCIAKGISGGYLPLAATLATEQIFSAFYGSYDELRTFYHGHSYTGNPLACAAGLASLDIFQEDQVIASLQGKIELLSELLEPFNELDHVGEIRQRGFMVGIELVGDKRTRRPFPLSERVGREVVLEARRRGVIIRPLGDVIVLMPPLSISAQELKELVSVVYEATARVTEKTLVSR